MTERDTRKIDARSLPTEINSVIDIYTRYVQACARKKKYRSVYRRSRGPFHGVRSREPRARMHLFLLLVASIVNPTLLSSTCHRNEYRDTFSLYRSQYSRRYSQFIESRAKESLNLYHDTSEHVHWGTFWRERVFSRCQRAERLDS